jgi:hypothetical protein
MENHVTEQLEPGMRLRMPIKYAVRIVVADVSTGLSVDFIALPGQEPSVTAGLQGARIDFFDLDSDVPDGIFPIKPRR